MTRRIIVIGGGISGLAAAHRLTELARKESCPLEITLLEASGRLGGVIGSERKDGFLIEAGPDSLISEKPWGIELCQRLGLGGSLHSVRPARQALYIVHRGTLVPMPRGFILMAPTQLWPLIRTPLFSWTGKLRMAMDLILPRAQLPGDESLASFVTRRLGREVLERVAQPLIGGVYAADPEELSLKSTMPRFLEMEKRHRSVIRATWLEQRRRVRLQEATSGARWSLFVTLAEGMQQLVNTLESGLPAGSLRLGTRAVGLSREKSQGGWNVITDGGEELHGEGVVIALPAYGAARVLCSLAPELARELQAIPYTSSATVSLAYRRSDVPGSLEGFGLVAPAREKRGIIACTFSSVKYAGRAPEGCELLRAFVGGALQPDLFEQDDETMEQSVRKELASLLGIGAKPLLCRIYRHPRSMPQYQVGHLDRVGRIMAQVASLAGLELAGNAYGGVGIADCVRSGEEAAQRLLAPSSVAAQF